MNYLYQIDYTILQDFGERIFKSHNDTKINFLENLNFSNFDADTIFILIVLVIFFIFLALDKPNKKPQKILHTPKPQIKEKSIKEAKKIKHKKKSIKRKFQMRIGVINMNLIILLKGEYKFLKWV